MTLTKTREYTGHSQDSLGAAIENARTKAGSNCGFEVIEAHSSYLSEQKKHYQVTLSTLINK